MAESKENPKVLDPGKAFDLAIKKGLENPEEYMYMYTKGGKNYFKHIDTRKYVKFNDGGMVRKTRMY
tara:strand:+ start:613 stop:813 length:201 start_codon:yes stop_codon:yes gene_type:complete